MRKNAREGLTPAEKCGIQIENINKWEGLLLDSLEYEK